MVIENAHATAGLKECWKHRLQVLKKDLGYDGAPMLEQLLIQQAALCWLKLNLVELELLGYDETIDHAHTRHVLGERVECRAKMFHSSLRDVSTSKKTLEEYTRPAGEYCNSWAPTGERREVTAGDRMLVSNRSRFAPSPFPILEAYVFKRREHLRKPLPIHEWNCYGSPDLSARSV
jgi:hypothetical protein